MSTIRQLSFSGGEVSPSLYGRVDQIKYATGLRTLRNGFTMRHGGVTNRPGSRFVTEVKDSTAAVRVIPFIFNADQTYILEFGNLYIRFIKDGVQLTVSGVATWNIATPYVVGDLVVEAGVNYYCIAANTGNQPPNASFWHPLTGNIYEIPTPYVEADLFTLNYVQSADVITIAHPNYAPRELSRTADTTWILSTIDFSPAIDPPTAPAVAGTAGSNDYIYHVTSVDAATFEESLAVLASGTSLKAPTESQPHTISWTEEAAASEYNVYLEVNGVPGFVGVAQGSQFVNDGITPDTTDTPPVARNPFSGAGDFPSTVTFYQQRRIFANTNNDPEKVFSSRTGLFRNFTVSSPLQDDDAVTFVLAGRQINEVRSLLELGTLVILTAGGEWSIRGDEAGVLRPTDVNSKQHSYNGSAELPPLIVNGNALYLQARGSIVRDLGFNFEVDGYRGNDLTIFSNHLFDPFTFVDWTYQQIPNSIVWLVRSDGALLGLTYVIEHSMLAWHHHDTDGLFESVASVPEGNEDVLYAVIQRAIDGSSVRYIEKFLTRQIDDIRDSVFVDSSLSYDGRNATPSHTMTLTSSGGGWTHLDDLTLTSSTAFFTAGDVGNEIHLTGSDGTIIRASITAFTSTTIVTVRPNKTVPIAMRSVAISDWSRAVDEFAGLDHLEGEDVSVFADGFVVANPNNAAYTTATVSSGTVTLDRPYAVVHIGLPYLFDLETLDIDTVRGETLMDRRKLISDLTLFVEDSRGIFGGVKPPTDDATNPTEGLRELKIRNDEGYDDPVDLVTGTVDIKLTGEWNTNGRIFIRQIDPVPVTILSVAPAGLVPFRG